MLRIITFTMALCLIGSTTFGQRYLDNNFFSDVKVTNGVKFGQNIEVGGTNQQELFMDIYEPDGDTASKRPIIFMAFGGSFTSGARDDLYLPLLGNYFAKLGYVAVSIDYRTGAFFPDPQQPQNSLLAVMRGVHDLKAAIRYFKKDAATVNDYKIDPYKVIVGGVSAGGIIGVHTAYFDQESEVPDFVDTTLFTSLGGIEGISGNPGYDSEVACVFSLSGVIADTLWVQPGDQPCISFHEVGDDVVPYDTREINAGGNPTGLIVSGSKDLHLRLENIGVPNNYTEHPGILHVGYLLYDLQNTQNSMRDFFYDNVASKELGPPTSILSLENEKVEIIFYPNPAVGGLSIINQENTAVNVSIYSILGQRVLNVNDVQPGRLNLDISGLSKGLYAISFEDAEDNTLLSTSKLMVK